MIVILYKNKIFKEQLNDDKNLLNNASLYIIFAIYIDFQAGISKIRNDLP